MNERFNELRLDAGISQLKDDPRLVVIDRKGNVIDPLIGLQKFAELIIAECANVAAEHDALDIYEEIREHFGIDSSDNIRAGAEVHNDKGYSESTKEKYEEAKQRREDRREIKSSLGYSRVGMWGR